MKKAEITLINGNRQPYTLGLPKLVILGKFNDAAKAHLEENTGLSFAVTSWGMEAQPENGNQIAALFMTYDFKTRFFNNLDAKNTIFLKSDHHIGWQVDSICFDCVKHNHIVTNGLKQGERLAA